MKALKDNILGKHFICTDIETTGLDPESPTAGILEVYMEEYDFDKDEINVAVHSLHYHPNHADTYFAHKIEAEEFEGTKLFTESEQMKNTYREMILKCCDPDSDYVFMSYYVPFEYQWFKKFLELTDEELSTLRVCDPREIAKILYPDDSHHLVQMAEKHCGITPDWGYAFHRSADDTQAMKMVYKKLYKDIKESDLIDYNPETYEYKVNEHFHD